MGGKKQKRETQRSGRKNNEGDRRWKDDINKLSDLEAVTCTSACTHTHTHTLLVMQETRPFSS